MLVELRQADELEAAARHVEQLLEGLGPQVVRREHDDVGALLLHEQSDLGDVRFVDQRDDVERRIGVRANVLDEPVAAVVGADHEHAAPPGEAPVHERLPGPGEHEHAGGHPGQVERREVQLGPHAQRGDEHGAGDGPERRRDGRAERQKRQARRIERLCERHEPDHRERGRQQHRVRRATVRGSSRNAYAGSQTTPNRPAVARNTAACRLTRRFASVAIPSDSTSCN